jgi:hypothetical protein
VRSSTGRLYAVDSAGSTHPTPLTNICYVTALSELARSPSSAVRPWAGFGPLLLLLVFCFP